MPQDLAYENVEALVSGLRTAKTALKAVKAEEDVLLASPQWSCWWTSWRGQLRQHKSFKEWLEMEKKVARKHKMKTIAAKQQGLVAKQRSRSEGAHGRAAPARQIIKSASYSIRAGMRWAMCPACKGQHRYVRRSREFKIAKRLWNYTCVHRKIASKAQARVLQEVRGCRLGTRS